MTIELQHNSNQRSITAVVLEDDDPTRLGMVVMLTDDGIDVVGNSADPHELLNIIDKYRPDIAFIDLKLLGDPRGGFKTAREIRSRFPATKCILRTAYPSVEDLQVAMDAGVKGFVQKAALPGTQPSLGQLARMIAKGGGYYDSEYVTKMREYIDPLRIRRDLHPETLFEPDALTEREREVLSLIARGSSNERISTELMITVNTVKAHCKNIYQKLNVDNREQAVIVARDRELI